MTSDSGPRREFLRHALATLAYRGGKAVRSAPPSFGELRIGETTRTPVDVLCHVADLLDWALDLASGSKKAKNSTPAGWDHEVKRFFAGLEALDRFLASPQTLEAEPEKLLQGPIADALTHVGQLTMLRRLGGSPVRGENYFVADIVTGRVGPEQSPPRREFD